MSEKGGGSAELLMVMALLIFFGISMYMLIFSSSSAMGRINAERDEQIEARTALSYINVRVRQFDAENSVAAVHNAYNGGDAILLKKRDAENPDMDYDTWIYWDNGSLMEVLSDAGAAPQWKAAHGIARVDGLRAEQKDGLLTSYIIYTYGGEQKTISSAVKLRSGNDGGAAA